MDPIPDGMNGYTTGYPSWPQIRIRSVTPKVPTGTGAQFVPRFKIIRDPIGIPDPDKLLQVTDLVGLKTDWISMMVNLTMVLSSIKMVLNMLDMV